MDILALAEDAFMLFIIVNPFGNLPLFLDLTSGYRPAVRMKTYSLAVAIAAGLVYIVSLSGKVMLDRVFRIGIDELKITGGLILLVLAVKNIVKGQGKKLQSGRPEDIVAAPMAFPMLVAAVSFVTGMLIMQNHGAAGLTLAVLAVFGAVWLVLVLLTPLFSRLGEVNLIILSKVMYIVLAGKAMKIVLTGIFRAGVS